VSNLEIRILLKMGEGIQDCNDDSIRDMRLNSSRLEFFISKQALLL